MSRQFWIQRSVLGLSYLVSPYDLFPDFFVGVGWLDDLIVLGVLWWYLYVYKPRQLGYQRDRGGPEPHQARASRNEDSDSKEEKASKEFGAGPGAVRFISGTYQHHIDLEQRLALFHDREKAMLFSAAYATVLGVLVPLISKDTVVISDSLNHNSIINALRLSRPGAKGIYQHLDLNDLDNQLDTHFQSNNRALVITDGIFSMRGDHAPLDKLVAICKKYEDQFPEGVITVVDEYLFRQ